VIDPPATGRTARETDKFSERFGGLSKYWPEAGILGRAAPQGTKSRWTPLVCMGIWALVAIAVLAWVSLLVAFFGIAAARAAGIADEMAERGRQCSPRRE
jgi:hypothetical protein